MGISTAVGVTVDAAVGAVEGAVGVAERLAVGEGTSVGVASRVGTELVGVFVSKVGPDVGVPSPPHASAKKLATNTVTKSFALN